MRSPDASGDPDALRRAVTRAVATALAEDLGDDGDVTTAATVPAAATGTAELVARAAGVIAGLDCARQTFAAVDGDLELDEHLTDGDLVSSGANVITVSGALRSILTAERTALNFLGHLSGIATATRRMVDAVDGTGCRVRDTRKTTPGLRLIEKAAVVAGGGVGHRVGLYDALLVKDNHVAAAGGVGPAARAALAGAGGRDVQVEVTTLAELDEALEAGVGDVLLDNLTPDEVAEAATRTAGRARLEASGTITLDTARDYAEAGADRIAVGAIVHSAPRLDIALDVRTVTSNEGAG